MKIQFHDTYRVKAGDNLAKIARSKGYRNPGPIVAYLPNLAFFRGRSPNLIRPNETFFIPWTQDLLRKFIATMEYLIRDVNETATKLVNEAVESKEELESFLGKIDAINLIAQIHVSIGSLAVEHAAHGFEMSSEKVLEWLADNRVHMIAGDMVPLMVPAPSAGNASSSANQSAKRASSFAVR